MVPELQQVGKIAVVIIFILILCSALLSFILPFFGWRIEIVLSGSMEPAIPMGSIVVSRPVAPETIREGDIIMYSSIGGKSLTTHRVDKVETEHGIQFITKGDANNGADPNPVIPGQLAGLIVFHIPYLGYLIQFVKTPLGFAIALLIPAAVLIASEVYNLWKAMD